MLSFPTYYPIHICLDIEHIFFPNEICPIHFFEQCSTFSLSVAQFTISDSAAPYFITLLSINLFEYGCSIYYSSSMNLPNIWTFLKLWQGTHSVVYTQE